MATLLEDCYPSGERKQLCYNYKSPTGCWVPCKKLHKLIFCRDFQNNRCQRGYECPYLHLGFREEWQYEQTQEITDIIRVELDRTLQYPSVVCNCEHGGGGSSTAGTGSGGARRCCVRRKIKHPLATSQYQTCCPVCRDVLLTGRSVALVKCRHVFCISCIEKISQDYLESLENNGYNDPPKCPLCKEEFFENGYEVIN